MRFLDFVKQHDLIGPASYGFGKGAAFLVTDIARGSADQASDCVFLHVFRHVDADKRIFIVEKIFGECFRQFGLADASWSEKHERANRPMRILQAGACTPYCSRNCPHGVLLTDDALCEFVFHTKELFLLSLEHPVDWYTGPARDDLGHVIGGYSLLDHRAFGFCSFDFAELFLQFRNPAVGQFTGALEFPATLRAGKFGTQLIKLGLELLRVRQFFFFRLPAACEVG